MQLRPLTFALTLALAAMPAALRADSITVDFADLGLGTDAFENGTHLSGGFTSRGAFFHNLYNTQYGSWSGWAYSSKGDTTTPGYTNQYSNITGDDHTGDGVFGVAVGNSQIDPPLTGPPATWIDLPTVSEPIVGMSAWLTNTTYTYSSITQGDPFAGDPYGTNGQEDFLRLTIDGYAGSGATGSLVGSIDVYLADFRGTASTVLDTWTLVDLSALADARSLGFRFASSRTTTYDLGGGQSATYIDTPTYFALDDLTIITAVPEPSSLALVALGAGALGLGWRRRRRHHDA